MVKTFAMRHLCELCHEPTHYDELYYERFTDTYMCANCKLKHEYELEAIQSHHTQDIRGDHDE